MRGSSKDTATGPHRHQRSLVPTGHDPGHLTIDQLEPPTEPCTTSPASIASIGTGPWRRHERPGREALVGITHHERVAVLVGQQSAPLVLDRVGVLVLVDQHVGEAMLVVVQHLGLRPHQFDRDRQQVVEVHGPRLAQPGLVLAVHVGDAPLDDDLSGIGVLLDAQAPVLGGRDGAVDRPGRQLLRVDLEVAQH